MLLDVCGRRKRPGPYISKSNVDMNNFRDVFVLLTPFFAVEKVDYKSDCYKYNFGNKT